MKTKFWIVHFILGLSYAQDPAQILPGPSLELAELLKELNAANSGDANILQSIDELKKRILNEGEQISGLTEGPPSPAQIEGAEARAQTPSDTSPQQVDGSQPGASSQTANPNAETNVAPPPAEAQTPSEAAQKQEIVSQPEGPSEPASTQPETENATTGENRSSEQPEQTAPINPPPTVANIETTPEQTEGSTLASNTTYEENKNTPPPPQSVPPSNPAPQSESVSQPDPAPQQETRPPPHSTAHTESAPPPDPAPQADTVLSPDPPPQTETAPSPNPAPQPKSVPQSESVSPPDSSPEPESTIIDPANPQAEAPSTEGITSNAHNPSDGSSQPPPQPAEPAPESANIESSQELHENAYDPSLDFSPVPDPNTEAISSSEPSSSQEDKPNDVAAQQSPDQSVTPSAETSTGNSVEQPQIDSSSANLNTEASTPAPLVNPSDDGMVDSQSETTQVNPEPETADSLPHDPNSTSPDVQAESPLVAQPKEESNPTGQTSTVMPPNSSDSSVTSDPDPTNPDKVEPAHSEPVAVEASGDTYSRDNGGMESVVNSENLKSEPLAEADRSPQTVSLPPGANHPPSVAGKTDPTDVAEDSDPQTEQINSTDVPPGEDLSTVNPATAPPAEITSAESPANVPPTDDISAEIPADKDHSELDPSSSADAPIINHEQNKSEQPTEDTLTAPSTGSSQSTGPESHPSSPDYQDSQDGLGSDHSTSENSPVNNITPGDLQQHAETADQTNDGDHLPIVPLPVASKNDQTSSAQKDMKKDAEQSDQAQNSTTPSVENSSDLPQPHINNSSNQSPEAETEPISSTTSNVDPNPKEISPGSNSDSNETGENTSSEIGDSKDSSTGNSSNSDSSQQAQDDKADDLTPQQGKNSDNASVDPSAAGQSDSSNEGKTPPTLPQGQNSNAYEPETSYDRSDSGMEPSTLPPNSKPPKDIPPHPTKSQQSEELPQADDDDDDDTAEEPKDDTQGTEPVTDGETDHTKGQQSEDKHPSVKDDCSEITEDNKDHCGPKSTEHPSSPPPAEDKKEVPVITPSVPPKPAEPAEKWLPDQVKWDTMIQPEQKQAARPDETNEVEKTEQATEQSAAFDPIPIDTSSVPAVILPCPECQIPESSVRITIKLRNVMYRQLVKDPILTAQLTDKLPKTLSLCPSIDPRRILVQQIQDSRNSNYERPETAVNLTLVILPLDQFSPQISETPENSSMTFALRLQECIENPSSPLYQTKDPTNESSHSLISLIDPKSFSLKADSSSMSSGSMESPGNRSLLIGLGTAGGLLIYFLAFAVWGRYLLKRRRAAKLQMSEISHLQ